MEAGTRAVAMATEAAMAVTVAMAPTTTATTGAMEAMVATAMTTTAMDRAAGAMTKDMAMAAMTVSACIVVTVRDQSVLIT